MADKLIIGLLNWFDEDGLALMQSIRDLRALGVTDLVAVHGRYGNYGSQAPLHHLSSEVEAIQQTCAHQGIALTMQIPLRPWTGDEVAKRERILELAHVLAGGEEAWLCVWDADYSLFTPADPPILIDFVGRSVDISFSDDPCEGDPHEASWYRMKMFMRLEPGMRMGANHYTYMHRDGEKLLILPKDEAAPMAPVRVRHLKYRRDQRRIDAQAAYYAVRDSEALETP